MSIQVETRNALVNCAMSSTKVKTGADRSRAPYASILRPDRISRILGW